jgi:hypothetical protein
MWVADIATGVQIRIEASENHLVHCSTSFPSSTFLPPFIDPATAS